ncbi:hypothetical protein LJC14_04695 [Treponema sp. OttesenSCG-928-L16]|nr:hypothetical protein [Treponema sp. OttesenSCG-928-L16]
MARKNFDSLMNPAKQFLSSYTISEEQYTEPQQKNHQQELKKKRLNLLIQPSLYEDIGKIAFMKRISINEAICQATREYRDNERRILDRYKNIIEQSENE